MSETATTSTAPAAPVAPAAPEGPSWIDRNPWAVTGLKGLGVGASAYSALALVKELLDAWEDRKAEKRRNKPSIAKDTIVVTLPNTVKGASARDALVEYAKIRRRKPGQAEPEVRQARNDDGTFASGFDVVQAGVKSAQDANAAPGATFLDETGDKILSWSAGLGSLGLGWVLAQKTYDYLKQRRLKREIAAAQKEYIDLLTPKQASSGVDPAPGAESWYHMEPSPGMRQGAENFMAGVGTLGVVLMAASSLITKKFLDERFADKTPAKQGPKVKNIVFKSASSEPSMSCDAIDILAYAKVASIVMGMPTEKTAAWFKDMKDGVVAHGSQLVYDTLGYGNDAHKAVGDVFGDLGMAGDDESQWNYDPTFGGEGNDPAHKVAWLPFTQDATTAQREAFQNAFMDDRYAKQREYIAKKAIGEHMAGFDNSEFGKTWIGQILSPLFGWAGDMGAKLLANTGWGSNLMFNRMQQRVRDSQAAKVNAGQPAKPVSKEPEPVEAVKPVSPAPEPVPAK